MHRFRRVLPVLLLLLGVWQIGLPAQAQDNLLKNPNFENPYGGIGTADGWDGGSVKTPHTESWMNIDALFTAHAGDKTYEGKISQQMGRGDATFTAAVWQKVENIQAGTKLRFTAWVYVESSEGSNARARIGIDSNNIASPMDDMSWSPYVTSYNTWQQLSVEAVVPAGYVTVYIFGTQDAPKPANQVYMDQASLTIVGTGQPVGQPTTAPTGGGSAPVVPVVPTTPPQTYAQSVSAQDTDATDGITHTVRAGDTLAAIAVGYRTTVTSILELNGITRGTILKVGQQLIIKKPEAAPPAEPTTAPETEPGSIAEVVAAVPTEEASGPSANAAKPTSDGSSSEPVAETTVEVAVVETEEAEPEPTDVPVEPTATTQPTNTPEPTQVAIVATSTSAVTSLESGVCVTFFDDKNQNHFKDEGEALLAGGLISVKDLQGKEVARHQTTADSAHCFTNLPTGSYNLTSTPPTGYGLTTPASLTVSVQAGVQFPVNIGAAQGVTPPATPTLSSAVAETLPDADAASPSSGLLVAILVGLVAVVAVVAGVLIFVIRRL